MSSLKPIAKLKGKAYWRGLDELAGSPEFNEFLQREFPAGASELRDPISRRTFITLMGASAALAGLTSCRRPVEKIVPYVKAPEEIIPGVAKYYATTMPCGAGGTGLLVESHEGRPTKIEGNPNHPASGGAASAWQQAEILNLYDPDRHKWLTRKGAQKTWQDFAAFWGELYAEFLANKGAGLAILGRSFSSPTLSRLQRNFQNTFPAAKWVTFDPVSDETLYEGIHAACGQNLQPVYHFAHADVILSLDADFLLTESESVQNARGFASSRRVATEKDEMNRLYVAESTYTITGSMADHRLPLQGGQIAGLVAAIAAELGKQGVAIAAADRLPATAGQIDQKWVSAVARDLADHRGKSLVVAGRRQPAAVHALVYAINSALGNAGTTVSYYPLADKTLSSVAELKTLVEAMRAGTVKTLFLLGGNPVYDAPVDLNFAAALARVEHSIHLGLAPNETSRRCEWQIPQTHFLEAWGDVRAADGTMSVIQPLIAPLFDSHSDVELLSLLTSGEAKPGYDTVRETWRLPARLARDERTWRKILHDGVLAGSALRPVAPSLRRSSLARMLGSLPAPATAAAENLEISFNCSPSLYDGRYANNGWLQEVPDPVTKLTWDNPALVSSRLADELGLESGDMIRLASKKHALELPVWILPGQADYTISVELGYGRKTAGRVGDDVGFNTYLLRTSRAPHYEQGYRLVKLDKSYMLASTQLHSSMHGRPIIREATLAHYREEPEFATEMVEHPPLESLWDDYSYKSGYQWGMTVDLNVCTGCNACTIACQSENNIPVVGKQQVANGREMHWIRLDRYFEGDEFDNPEMVHQPVMCQHCETAPCEQVCPVQATSHDKEGLNVMTYNRCIGTRYCSNNCPYKVRRFNFFNYTSDTPEIVKMAMNPDVTVRFRGVMEKCTYCLQRINAAKIKAKSEDRQVRDREILTACQQTCPTNAIVFGNINDPDSEVTRIKEQNRRYDLLAELNVRPRTSYLARLRNLNASLKKEGSDSPSHA